MKTVKKLIAILLSAVMCIGCFSLVSFAAEATDHLAEVPDGYVGVYTKDDLNNIRKNMSGKYILMNDIVFEDSDFEKDGCFYNDGTGWEPIGTSSTYFTGVFDGNGYTIKNLYINNSEQNYIGLFGYISGAAIKNLTMKNSNIAGKNFTGGIVGYSSKNNFSNKNTTISYCRIQGKVSGIKYVGGVVGYIDYTSVINNCDCESNVIGELYIGGVIGYVSSGTVTACNYFGMVTGGDNVGGVAGSSTGKSIISYCSTLGGVIGVNNVGGVVGYQSPASTTNTPNYIEYCCNSATICAKTNAGGVVGSSMSCYSDQYIQFCLNNGSVTASSSNAGGIAGYSDYYQIGTIITYTSIYISCCYNSGSISSSDYVGGLVGKCISDTFVKHCYSVGTVIGKSYFGGCFGINPQRTTFCYYLDEGVVEPTCMSGTAKSADQLRRATAYEQWDFTNVWTMDGREDYPYPELINTPLVLPGDFHEHDYKSEVTTPATHLKTGVMTYTCECGDSYTEEIEKTLGHSYTSKVTTPATHTSTGVMTYTCECGDSYTEEIEKTPGHSYTSKVTTPATHTSTGIMTYTCECGDSYTEEIEKTPGHSYTSKVTTPATHTSTGIMTYTCECGDSYTEEIEKTPGHSYTSKVTTPATHTSTGVMTYTCECGDSYTETIEKTAEHSYSSVATDPTCTEGGYTTYTCACGDSYVSDYVDALGHTDGDWVVTKPATTTHTGTKTQSCSVCGKLLKTETIPMLPAKVHSVSVSGVSLDYKSTGTIATAINADTGAKYTVTYSSSNSTVASVDANGKVTAGKTGSATITCTVTDEYGNVVSDTCEVKVSYNWWQWIIVIVLFGWIWY